MYRKSKHSIMPEIQSRFSNRALSGEALPQDDIEALLEAASFAPSCFNEQPWRFLAARETRKDLLCACLTAKNQAWACKAPLLILVCAKKTFAHNGRDNRWHLYDTGCAVGFLILEAERRGLVAHPMAGFNAQAARERFGISEDLDIITVVAVGKNGDVNDLGELDRERNHPNPRMPVGELML